MSSARFVKFSCRQILHTFGLQQKPLVLDKFTVFFGAHRFFSSGREGRFFHAEIMGNNEFYSHSPSGFFIMLLLLYQYSAETGVVACQNKLLFYNILYVTKFNKLSCESHLLTVSQTRVYRINWKVSPLPKVSPQSKESPSLQCISNEQVRR